MAHLVCSRCGTRHPLDARLWRCPCGGMLDIARVPSLDPPSASDVCPTLWRYRRALALAADAPCLTLGEGCTPLVSVQLAGHAFLAKLEQLAPTGSFKDRGAATLMSQAAALGVDAVVEDSSGNAGSAIAAYGACAGIACHIYVPASTAPAKLAQIAAYGATLHRIDGPRQRAADAALAAAENSYYASHVWNPFFLEGTKTWAYEVCEQLGWRAPDAVVLPVGNGTLLLGAALGFRELRQMGLIDRMPRLIGVQAEACAPLVQAFCAGLDRAAPLTPKPTRAKGIAIAAPRRGHQILAAIRASGGAMMAVSDKEITAAQEGLAHSGWYLEPTAAVAPAALVLLRETGTLSGQAVVVTAFTGHGLKDIASPAP